MFTYILLLRKLKNIVIYLHTLLQNTQEHCYLIFVTLGGYIHRKQLDYYCC